jgi:hypothetical protein
MNTPTIFIKATDIVYDTDHETQNLPTDITFEVDNDFEPEDGLADLVSEETGYAVKSLNYLILEA